ncbi:helix-turn-helix domain-containing protein [Blastococcus sp. BMG 814]|uniref:Helix-turn-helix domain-containing protein n=1 Tax=Blastococcus carthaginiensis TaxID=3050034 RepID=A0ABT9I8F6_9ACTN|nr:helix-turn-helix domain-containing protein [Blastococcus carthaginiensis]MDP5181856.1 helix-turn-helix domain-containing protein [Blastococcus carthaginiensis]
MAADPLTRAPVEGAGATTRARMVDVAERLFAEYGIEAVSLRMVGAAAGQRNNSVAQYHFGSKEGLIEAVIAARSPLIDARRLELVTELQATGERLTPASLLHLLVRPLAETIGAGGERTYYLRFLASLMDHPTFVRNAESSGTDQPALRWMRGRLRALCPSQSAATFRRRSQWAALIAFRILAEQERQLASGDDRAAPTEQVVGELVATLVALMTAPVGDGALPPR